MSTFLRLRLVGINLTEDRAGELLRRVQQDCAADVPHNLLVNLRFNRILSAAGTDLEPFVAGASLLALYGQRRKRPHVARLLRAFADAAFALTDNVELRLETAHGSEMESADHERDATLDEVLALRRLPARTVVRLKRGECDFNSS